MPEIVKSKNHVAFSDCKNYEYVLTEGHLYKCSVSNPFDTEDNRLGAWECSEAMALNLPDIYPFLQPQKVDSWQERVYNAPVTGRGTATLFRSPVTGGYVGID
ncbi:hypothetical protein Lepto7375DRAFT_7263 [Leptolyngbya sp. PCC 7375]|nr:hypothetical protein Lepto7375DRAFT_7263 [Leptolyngbya sp. PCC 7375]